MMNALKNQLRSFWKIGQFTLVSRRGRLQCTLLGVPLVLGVRE